MTTQAETGMPRDLLLVRHGESEGNVARDAAKRGDSSKMDEAYRARSAANYRLSDRGQRQAVLAGLWITAWLTSVGAEGLDRAYCSTFARARETAALLGLSAVRWQLEPLLRERDFGLMEGLSKKEIEVQFERSTHLKNINRFLWRPEGGESTPDVDLRCREMLGTFARELAGGRVICVTHEDVMWALRFRLEKLTVQEWTKAVEDHDRGQIPNCGILHYTRLDEAGVIQPRFTRVRLVDPAQPNAWSWTTIVRPLFTNDDLLAQVDEISPLWRD
jgi:NAD+ kinase